ncbi:MAG: hypothetical protein ACHP7D_00635 [Lysobacterales bacterium]
MRITAPVLRGAALGVLMLLAACAAPVRTPPGGSADVRIERVDKTFDLDHGITRVAIDNPWGEINVRARDEREVGIHAVIQRLPPQFANAVLRPHRDGDTLRIEVGFEGAAPQAGRIDIAVFLPGEVALALRTQAGRISAKKRAGPVEAATDSGEILVSSHARLSLHTRSGQIRAIAIGKRWQGNSEIVSDSGRIILLVPTFGDVALSAETGARLGTNYGLSVHRDGDGLSHASARYGQGTSVLDVRSRTGEIVLEQLVLLGDDARDPGDDD